MESYANLEAKRRECAATIHGLQESRNNDRDREWTADDQAEWDRAVADYTDLKERCERAKLADDIARDNAEPIYAPGEARTHLDGNTPRVPAENGEAVPATRENLHAVTRRALMGWLQVQHGRDAERSQVQAAAYLRSEGYDFQLSKPEIDLPLLDSLQYRAFRRKWSTRAQSTTDGEGGYTIPEGFSNEWEKALLAFGGMRQASRIIRTDSGNDLPWPMSNDTGNAGVILAENNAVAEQDITFTVETLTAHKFSSKLVRVSAELLIDSAFDFEAELGALLGERIGRIQNTEYTTGDNSAAPTGILDATGGATTGLTTSGSSFTTANIYDLLHSVDRAYRTSASCGFMMHDTNVARIKKLASGDALLWQPSLRDGEPDSIAGFQYWVNNDFPSTIGGSEKCMAFGDFSKYIIRDAGAMRLLRLRERYAEYDQSGFVAFHRSDGEFLNGGGNPIKVWVNGA